MLQSLTDCLNLTDSDFLALRLQFQLILKSGVQQVFRSSTVLARTLLEQLRKYFYNFECTVERKFSSVELR